MCAAVSILVCRGYELSILFLDLAQQVMQFCGVLLLQESLDLLPGLAKPASERISQRQIVTVVVRSRD